MNKRQERKGNGEWGVGNGEWGVGNEIFFPTPHSPFPTPHSPPPTPQIQTRNTLMFLAVKDLIALSEVALYVTRAWKSFAGQMSEAPTTPILRWSATTIRFRACRIMAR